jgi:cell division protein FtsZ
MADAGSALMGIGRGSGDNRAIEAARAAIDSPLLELSIDGAKGILFNITGGPDLGMYEIDEAAKAITEAADADANIIFGAIIDEAMQGEVKITVIATGFETDNTKLHKRSSLGMGSTTEIPPSQMVTREERRSYEEPDFGSFEPRFDEEPKTEEKEEEKDDGDLEVPAFIRRKLR